MTNTTDNKPKIEVLTWNGGAHLKCKCGHAWNDHDGLGCLRCNCLQ